MSFTSGVTPREGSAAAPRDPLLGWPRWAHLRKACWLALGTALIFALVYGGADWLTGFRARRHVHLPFELGIPFVPAMVVPYLSLNGLFLLAPFILRTSRELRALAVALVATILAAGLGFLLLPAELGFPEPTQPELGRWRALFDVADGLNLRYNLVPSLHVAMSMVCVAAYAARSGPLGKIVFWYWGLAITVSTVLLHQHHLLDVATGLLLAGAVNRWVHRSWCTQTLRSKPAATLVP